MKKSSKATYVCPFCKKEIKDSSKTEIFYRNTWVNGCCDCFVLSINKVTAIEFQQRSTDKR